MARQIHADFFRVGLAKRVNHQAGLNLLVAATELFFHRDRLICRINRIPDFARGNCAVLHQVFNKRCQRGWVRRVVEEPNSDNKGTMESATPQRPPAHRPVHVDEDF